MPSRNRQRQLARAKLNRQLARRAAAARKRRQLTAGVSVTILLAALVVGGLWTSGVFDSDPAETADSVTGSCAWIPDTSGSPNRTDVGTPPPVMELPTGTGTMTLTTNLGVIEISLDVTNAPCAATSFKYLADEGFFDNTTCHRLTTEGLYVLQCGDPSGTGSGGPTYSFADENLPSVDSTPSADPSASTDPSASADPSTSADPSASPTQESATYTYTRGTVAMANSGPNTNGSQFFIVYQDSPLPPNYSIIGTVTQGLEIVDQVAAGGATGTDGATVTDGTPATTIRLQSVTVTMPGEPTPSPSTTASTTPSAIPSVETEASATEDEVTDS